MAKESPFEKKFVEESEKSDLPGVLDQLSLPPALVEFARANQRAIKTIVIAVAVVVVAWSLFDAYRANRLQKSDSALYAGLQVAGDEKSGALEKVVADYAGTPASTWAQLELGHAELNDGKFAQAVERYTSVRESVGKKSPLYPLITYGIARALEAQKEYAGALAEYEVVKGIEGFESIGTLGMAKIHEIEGRKKKALEIYEQHLSSFEGEQQNNPDKILIEEKIARIRATM